MGRHKLLMPWPPCESEIDGETTDKSANQSSTILDSVLSAWHESLVDHIVIVFRASDSELPLDQQDLDRLIEIASRYRVDTVFAKDPLDMKASVLAGLRYLKKRFHLSNIDSCFVSPSDLPGISTHLINQLLKIDNPGSKVLVPVFGEKDGHPVLFPWCLISQTESLPENAGIRDLINPENRMRIPFSFSDYVSDIDTLEEYKERMKDDCQ